jgi:hypothetical protein
VQLHLVRADSSRLKQVDFSAPVHEPNVVGKALGKDLTPAQSGVAAEAPGNDHELNNSFSDGSFTRRR